MIEEAQRFGQFLRQERTRRGMTRKEVAEMAGIHPKMLTDYEQARHLPRLETAIKLAGIFGKTIEDVMK